MCFWQKKPKYRIAAPSAPQKSPKPCFVIIRPEYPACLHPLVVALSKQKGRGGGGEAVTVKFILSNCSSSKEFSYKFISSQIVTSILIALYLPDFVP